MKDKIKKFLVDGRGAILAIFILQFILMFFITPNKYDDEKFLNFLETDTIKNILTERYYGWSSRFIIDYTFLNILKISKYLWIVLQAAMMALIGYSISKLFVKKQNKKEMNIMILFLILTYPIDVMNGAGWGASTLNYIWPLATALFCMISIKKVWDGEKIKLFEYPLYALALIFACNHEQTCAIIFGTYLLFTILLIIKNKKIHPFIIIQLILAIGSLIFILTAPGNYVRKETETIMCFPDFKMLNFQDKISLGITSTLGTIINDSKIPFAILSLMIVGFIFVNYKEKIYRIVALIPFVTICALGLFFDIAVKIFPYLGSLVGALTTQSLILNPMNCNNLFYAIPLILSISIFASMILSILLIFKKLNGNIAVLVYLVGLASRIMMGFSPTVFMSSTRTLIFFDFAMLIVALLIWQEFSKNPDKTEKKAQKRICTVVQLTAIFQYINVLLAILLTQK